MSRYPQRSEGGDVAQASLNDNGKSSAGWRLKNMLFTVTVTLAFALGLYSLFLAYTNAGKVQPLTTEGLLRTATVSDTKKIETALGVLTDQDLVYVVLDSPESGPDPDVEIAVRGAARVLNDSGLAVSVRLLDPGDPDFSVIVAQNAINRFPAVLVVKEKGGIVWVMDDFSTKSLLNAYYVVWGKSSSCDEAKSAVY